MWAFLLSSILMLDNIVCIWAYARFTVEILCQSTVEILYQLVWAYARFTVEMLYGLMLSFSWFFGKLPS